MEYGTENIVLLSRILSGLPAKEDAIILRWIINTRVLVEQPGNGWVNLFLLKVKWEKY